mgnify:CR=1 FL=1
MRTSRGLKWENKTCKQKGPLLRKLQKKSPLVFVFLLFLPCDYLVPPSQTMCGAYYYN